MRRAIPVLAATAGALALLANFHTSPSATGVAVPAGAGATPPAAGDPTPTTGPPAPAGSSPAGATRTVDGPVVGTDYGDVQVRVTLAGSRITDVQAVQLPFDRSKSQRISAQAGPRLRSEALKAQSARIDSVSGATYTSAGYAKSLQGALDSAGR